jgi:ADP-ribose pyrophosphatase YjhB (NUDIX family)
MKSSVLVLIFNSDRNQILLIKRRDVPVWVLPGGGVDPGESYQSAAIRESQEETGLHVEIIKHVAEYTPLNNLAKLTNVYECQMIAGELTTGSETKEIAFFPIENLPSKLFFLHKKWIMEALNAKDELIRRPIFEVTYSKLLKYFLSHPTDTLLFILSRLGLPINN